MQRILNKNYLSVATLLLALATLSGAVACSSTSTAPETTSNTNATSNANNNASAASPTIATNSNMSGMDHGNTNAHTSGMNHSMMQSSPNAASQPYDLQFLDTMMAHHQGAIDMARPAEAKAQHPELKQLAHHIVDDQQKEIGQMKSWREKWYPGKPEAMNMEMSGMMDGMKGMDMGKLNAASGNAFDLMFIDMMTPHHQGAVTMAREALTRSEHPEIKKLAQQIIDAQDKEIAQMNKWKAAWAGGSGPK